MTSIVPEQLERTDGAEAPLLDVRDLRTYFKTDDGIVRAVDGVSFSVRPGQTLGVVGESGSGKSVTMMSILSLNPKPGRMRPAEGSPPGPQMDAFLHGTKKHTSVSTGQALFRGENLLEASQRRLRALRGNEISMIFQDPMTSLNPVLSIGNQLAEAIMLHRDVTSRQARELAIAGLQEVGISRPERRIDDYPHQFSGGMRQRVMIAIALACNPKLLIADEPTTALDVTIQAQILDLMLELKSRLGMAVMLITHAMGVVAETAQRVVVMYAGKVVEEAPVKELFAHPRHPYTQGLIRSIPRIDTAALHKVRLEAIAGTVPKLIAPPEGCRFAARCKYVMRDCTTATPRLREVAPGHKVACILESAGS
jgi:peptide/nickel transport system ATP-binding protein